ncbi:MAG: hypothetical protein ACRCWR_01925 [Saezia sp.]
MSILPTRYACLVEFLLGAFLLMRSQKMGHDKLAQLCYDEKSYSLEEPEGDFMKKLFVTCFSVFLLLGCASTPQGQTSSPFAIDAAATAKAPWKAGEVIADSISCPVKQEQGCYRVFLGVTHDGHKVLQEFYNEGKLKATDPFLIKPTVEWKNIEQMDEVDNPLDILDSNLKAWYPAGTKHLEWVKNDAGHYQVTMWHESGKKKMQANFIGGEIKDLTPWDEEGKPLMN